MATAHVDPTTEPARMVRKYFVATTVYVVAFVIAVMLVVEYMPSNDGAPAPITTPQHLASK